MSYLSLKKALPARKVSTPDVTLSRETIWKESEVDIYNEDYGYLFRNSKIISVSTNWYRPIIAESKFPIFWVAAIIILFFGFYYSHSMDEVGYIKFIIDDAIITASLMVFGALCWSIRFIKFKTKVKLDPGPIIYKEKDEETGAIIEKEADWKKRREIFKTVFHDDWFGDAILYYQMTPSRAAWLDKDVKYNITENDHYDKIDQGMASQLITPLMDVNYNPHDISVVKKDRVGWRYIPSLLLFIPLAYLPLLIIYGIGKLLGPQGYDLLGTGVIFFLGVIAGIWAVWLTFIGILFIFRSIARLIIGMPQEIDPFEYRINIRSLSGKWTVLLKSKSNVLATQMYNIVSEDIRKKDIV